MNLGGMMSRAKDFIGGLLGGGQSQVQGQPEAQPPSNAVVTGTVPPMDGGELKLWKNRIRRAKDHHRKYFEMADIIKREYLGPQNPAFKLLPRVMGDGGRPINLVSSYVNTTMPQILPSNPWPIVEQKQPGDVYEQGARLLEARLRQVYDCPETYLQLRRVFLDAYFCAGFALVGWKPQTSEQVIAKESSQAQDDQGKDDAAETVSQPGEPNAVGPDTPFIRHIPYRCIEMDPDAELFDDARWVGYFLPVRLSELKKIAGYHDVEDIRPDNLQDEDDDKWQDRARP